jgi:aryl-alcohol dehydrogenase-like predicted oxidoreductase
MSVAAPSPFPTVPLGSQGLVVPRLGLGCMGMTAFYVADPKQHEEESLRTIARSLELGCNFLDTAWIYRNAQTGDVNEALVGRAIAAHGREKFIIATKFGIDRARQPFTCSSPAVIREQLEQSLERLGTTYIDLYYQHRVDPTTPMEVVAQTLKELVAEGKIRYVGLSECTADELRRVHAIQPVSACQMEWSLNTRDLEATIVPACRELGVSIVAYSPLGRGLLSNRIATRDAMEEGDTRAMYPRFGADVLEANLARTQRLEAIARTKGATAAQLALAWLLHHGGDAVVPIPGTKTVARLEENLGAAAIALSAADMAEIEAALPGEAAGSRYPAGLMDSSFNARV